MLELQQEVASLEVQAAAAARLRADEAAAQRQREAATAGCEPQAEGCEPQGKDAAGRAHKTAAAEGEDAEEALSRSELEALVGDLQSEAERERAAKEQAFLKNFTIREELAAASRQVASLKARVQVRSLG